MDDIRWLNWRVWLMDAWNPASGIFVLNPSKSLEFIQDLTHWNKEEMTSTCWITWNLSESHFRTRSSYWTKTNWRLPGNHHIWSKYLTPLQLLLYSDPLLQDLLGHGKAKDLCQGVTYHLFIKKKNGVSNVHCFRSFERVYCIAFQ